LGKEARDIPLEAADELKDVEEGELCSCGLAKNFERELMDDRLKTVILFL
jgi:hypothetical protein